MSPMPCEQDAAAIVRRVAGTEPRSITRFPTGLCHYVYDVAGHDFRCVVRIASASSAAGLAAAWGWSGVLKPLGVPLPAILHSGVHHGFSFHVLERLPGTDLCNIYRDLSPAQKRQIAFDVIAAQHGLGTLPEGRGYGFVSHINGPFPHSTWREVIEANLKRSQNRLAATQLIDLKQCRPFNDALDAMDSYLARVVSRPFLDDVTTKNVICSGGRFSGIVDVDALCYGDSLFTPALTKASLIGDNSLTDYVDYWLEHRAVGSEQRAAFDLYTAAFCLDLISEMGQRFNKDIAEPIDGERLERLQKCMHECLLSILRS